MLENKLECLTHEDRLCLLLSLGQLTPEEQTRTRKFLSAPVQWSQVLDRAYTHQTYPLVYCNLRELEFFGVPDAVRAELKSAYLANALRNQLLSNELARLLNQLSEAKVPAIPLKGVSLAESLYGDPAARVSTDLDLLVPTLQLDHAIEVIRAAGYADKFDDSFFRRLDLRHGRHYSFEGSTAGYSTLVELHWRLVQHSSRDADAVKDLWTEAQPTRCFGVPACRLSPEWEFLYLSIHAADHGWQGLKWLVDVHHLSTSRPPDWRCVAHKAEQFGLDRVVARTLATCSLLLETPLPKAYSSVVLPARLASFPLMDLTGARRTAAFSHLPLLQQPWDKLRCVANVVFVPKPADRNFLRLPRALSLLYYPLRVLRLVAKLF
jgi:hypothetical protein